MSRAAKRYAKALIDLALEKKEEAVVQKDMQLIYQTIAKSDELQTLLDNPVFNEKQKEATLQKVFKSSQSKITGNLLQLLAKNKRIPLLQNIASQYEAFYNELKNTVEAVVTTTFPIDEVLKEKVMTKAQELAKDKKVNLQNKIDERIIGGFILRVGDVQIDASVSNKLGNLKRTLNQNQYQY